MNAEIGIRGLGQYDATRRELERLQREFEDAAENYPSLGHQLVSPLEGPLTKEQWSAFKNANSDQNGDWQKWDDLPGGDSCGRFFGDEISLNSFIMMAEMGMAVLSKMRTLADESESIIPFDLVLRLPACGGYHGWLQLLYGTARCYSTPFLHAEPSYWGCAGQFTAEEDSESISVGGVLLPAHPFYEVLRYDLFKSSAEAIGYWLDPELAFDRGDHVTETPIHLPPEPERNGPSLPDAFWLGGKKYEGFSRTAWRLLECLYGKEWVSMDDAIRHVYGDCADQMEKAIISAQKRLSKELDAKGCPVEVHRKQAGFYLEVFRQP